jgi:hypothetical protein
MALTVTGSTLVITDDTAPLSGAVASGGKTDDTLLSFSGTTTTTGGGTGSLKIWYSTNGGATATLLQTVTLSAANGAWSFTSTTALSTNTTYTYYVTNGAVATWGGTGLVSQTVVFDNVAPTVSSVAVPTSDTRLVPGETIVFTVTFSEAVTVAGSPKIVLNNGASATYISGTGTTTLTFSYTVVSGDSAVADLKTAVTSALNLNGGSIRDAAGTAVAVTSFNNIDPAPSTTIEVVCFLPGTMIATPDGERAIETLAGGDLVTLADGSAKPVKWLGRMSTQLHAFNRDSATPILIKAGALSTGLPRRDLYTSYRHGFEVDGVLVIAGLLVNGTSVIQCSDWKEASVTYYQVEVEGHELMLAEGAPAETFLEDGENREMFDNAAEFHAMYPGAPRAEPMPLGRVTLRRQLPRSVVARLESAAVEAGYVSYARAA